MHIAWSILPALLLLHSPPLAMGQAQDDICALFKTSEISTVLGTKVEAGDPLRPLTGCQWFGKDEESYAVLQVAGTENWVEPRQAPGFEAGLDGGEEKVRKAYSHPDEEGGWRAMALTRNRVYIVVLVGRSAERSGATTAMKLLLERHK